MNRDLDLQLTPEERRRLQKVVSSLGTTVAEFTRFALMEAVVECEGLAAEAEAVTRWYAEHQRPAMNGNGTHGR